MHEDFKDHLDVKIIKIVFANNQCANYLQNIIILKAVRSGHLPVKE